jgi:hypothetical protein
MLSRYIFGEPTASAVQREAHHGEHCSQGLGEQSQVPGSMGLYWCSSGLELLPRTWGTARDAQQGARPQEQAQVPGSMGLYWCSSGSLGLSWSCVCPGEQSFRVVGENAHYVA